MERSKGIGKREESSVDNVTLLSTTTHVPVDTEWNSSLKPPVLTAENVTDLENRRARLDQITSITVLRNSDVTRPMNQIDVDCSLSTLENPDLGIPVIALVDLGCTVVDTHRGPTSFSLLGHPGL